MFVQETSTERGQSLAAISVVARWLGRLRGVGLLSVLFLPVSASAVAPQTLPYGTTLERHFGETNSAPDENQMSGSQIKVLDFEDALKAQARSMAQGPLQSVHPGIIRPASEIRGSLVLPVVLPSIALLAAALAGFGVKRKFDALALAFEEEANSRLNVTLLDPALEAFFVALRDGLGASAADFFSEDASALGKASAASLKEFFESTAVRFANLRKLVTDLARATEQAGRQKVLSELCHDVGSLKESAHIPALQPVWTLACALEGLLTQLSREASPLNASAQRTTTGAIDLLQALCIRDLNPNLTVNPPVRILAVDDDAISRRAISFALRKAFDHCTLAPDGKVALELASRHPYDVIFLDVEMPGMDGFELCTKIHETPRNKSAPIVFVTRHSDFGSRAKSSLSGGQDLIGKPYLSFEITVKALTLVLGNRLRGGTTPQNAAEVVEDASARAPLDKGIEPAAELEADKVTGQRVKAERAWKPAGSAFRKTTSATEPTTGHSATPKEPATATSRKDSHPTLTVPAGAPEDFSAWSPDYLNTLRDQVKVAMLCKAPEEMRELITGLYLAVHSYSEESERGGFSTIHRLSSALEAMLKKVMEKPQFRTHSMWNTALAALDVLAQVPCRSGSNLDFTNPPTRILVVDDDPVARRAISGSIQLVFGGPAQAESGETALAIASEKAFELIFLDIMMPGIDGFAACSKIRETGLNQATPIVFISNHDDPESREKAAMSGGSGFIPKPVFASQIMLTALTSILRKRLGQTASEGIVAARGELATIEA